MGGPVGGSAAGTKKRTAPGFPRVPRVGRRHSHQPQTVDCALRVRHCRLASGVRSFEEELHDLERASLRRSLHSFAAPQGVVLPAPGRSLVNFSSNDYLGLAAHPLVREALQHAVEKHGAGSGASRLVCGTLDPHTELEETLAAFKGAEAAITFSSGHAAALGTLGALLRPGDVAILDRLSHASLVDGTRASGATLRSFRHNDLAQLENRLAWAANRVTRHGRLLVVTEGIFSMDGDRAPLRDIAALARSHQALLLVDEAHSFGVCGRDGRGLAEALGVAGQIDLHLGTLSKAVGLAGGYVAASRPAVDLIVNRARSLIYSTAPPPALAAAASFVVREIFAQPAGAALRDRLWQNTRHLGRRLGNGPPGAAPPEPPSPILPLLLGTEPAALEAAAALRQAGFLVPAIRPPSVPRGQSRLRLTVSASHTPAQIDALADALDRLPAVAAGASTPPAPPPHLS
jgi:8-amino-7-oxononanoate synthase